jgi:hypothetical protein
MHPRIAELLAFIDVQRLDLEQAVAELPLSDLTARPEPDRWSVAEILEHLVLIERGLGTLFGRWLAPGGVEGLAVEENSSPILPEIDTGPALDRSRRIKTIDAGEPGGQLSVAESWLALDEARRTLKDAIALGDGLALGEIVRPHRTLGRMNMYEWIAFVGTHMARHAAQIRETGVVLQRAARPN